MEVIDLWGNDNGDDDEDGNDVENDEKARVPQAAASGRYCAVPSDKGCWRGLLAATFDDSPYAPTPHTLKVTFTPARATRRPLGLNGEYGEAWERTVSLAVRRRATAVAWGPRVRGVEAGADLAPALTARVVVVGGMETSPGDGEAGGETAEADGPAARAPGLPASPIAYFYSLSEPSLATDPLLPLPLPLPLQPLGADQTCPVEGTLLTLKAVFDPVDFALDDEADGEWGYLSGACTTRWGICTEFLIFGPPILTFYGLVPRRLSPALNYLPCDATTSLRVGAPAPAHPAHLEWPAPRPLTYGTPVGAHALCARVVPPQPGTLLYYVPDYLSPAAEHLATPQYVLAATAEVCAYVGGGALPCRDSPPPRHLGITASRHLGITRPRSPHSLTHTQPLGCPRVCGPPWQVGGRTRGGPALTRVSPGGALLLGAPQSPHTLRVEFRPAGAAAGAGAGAGVLVATVQLQVRRRARNIVPPPARPPCVSHPVLARMYVKGPAGTHASAVAAAPGPAARGALVRGPPLRPRALLPRQRGRGGGRGRGG